MKKQFTQSLRFARIVCFIGLILSLCIVPPDTVLGETIPVNTDGTQVILDKNLATGNISNIGMTDNDHVIIVSIQDYPHSKGAIIRENVRTTEVVNRVPLSPLIDPADLHILPNGKFIVTDENKTDPSLPHVQSHRVTLIDSTSLHNTKTIDLGKENDISGLLVLQSDKDHIIVKLTSLIPIENDFTYGKDRFVWLNVNTDKIDKTILYSHARGVQKILFSSDHKYLACFFPNDEDPKDQTGILDVLDPNTGKILWHLEGSETQPIGDPFFFISPTKFVSSSAIYDITTKTHSPLIPANNLRLYCITNVTGKTDYAFFMTKAGLELWNIKTNQALRRWPDLTGQGFILMSPDLKTVSYQQGENIQFWRFDPAWLK
ncbi:MAG: hypothetical protein ABI210_08685 [Abditibacteriaceae bacterium]